MYLKHINGKFIFAVTLVALFLCWIPLDAQADLLIEAESFQDKGGWKVDPQFCDIMGSPYLLAHGLGVPVDNAAATVTFSSRGQYTIWVRTKNWVPGDWESPGQFMVLINGRPVNAVFGVNPKWNWQSGGQVDIKQETVKLELQDLTGFDGRCDALFFTKNPLFIPPNDGDGMRHWRNTLSGIPEYPSETREFDVVIVGGGIAGCAASMAAAQQGLTVALIHDRPVLGGNASSEVRVHTLGITGKSENILSKLNTEHWPNGSEKALADDAKRAEAMDAQANIKQFLCWRACDAKAKDGHILYVDARHVETGDVQRFKAPIFIDCTGDGWIGYWAGAEFRYGRESQKEFDEGWNLHGELWSPEKADNRVMGASLLWYSRETKIPADFPDVPWAVPVAGNMSAVKGEWFWEYSDNDKHQIKDAEAIRDHLLRAIYGSFVNAKKAPANRNRELEWVGFILGKRESRRLMGDYIYSMQDMLESRTFPDTVVEETREIDVHYQQALKDSRHDFLSEALYRKTEKYYIPFRCLYSKNIDNLMMAGRCFSCSHVGLAGPRVMNTTGQMGVAVGYAASLCIRYDINPRRVYQDHITELRKLIGYE